MDLQQLVAETDTGGRKVGGLPGRIIFWVAVGWSLFQLWYASPLPFSLGMGILNDTEARSLHLGIALFLGYLCYPAFKRSSRAVDSTPKLVEIPPSRMVSIPRRRSWRSSSVP